ncbi:MAG: DUF2911 domain-containing protein [Acidobacteriales bacterium]|nr:DUF2911 domain-containing protein [Terriglobales bacterium]
MKRVAVASLLAVAVTVLAFAQQDKSKRESPPSQAQFTFADGKKITIDYSRPSVKGRKIYGGLVPYGAVWRTGANEATTFVTEKDIDVGGTRVPQGSYTLFSLPAEAGWKLIVNKQTGQWGTKYDQSQDLARIDAQKQALPRPVEQFTISFEPASGDATVLRLDWENTRVSVPVK